MYRHAWLVLFALAGCAAPLTHGQPVEIVARGKWQVGTALGVSASTGLLDVADAAQNQARSLANQQLDCTRPDRTDCARVSQVRDLTKAVYTAGLAGLVDPFAELSVHYGLLDRMAVGGRIASGSQRLDIDWQLADGGPNRSDWMALASLSYSHQSATVAIPYVQTVLEKLGLDETSRHNLDFALAGGHRISDYGWFTFGARYLVGRYRIDLRPQVPLFDDQFDNVLVHALPQTDETGFSHHVGGFVHALLGYKHAYAGLELSATYFFAKATLLGKEERFSGVAIQPSFILLSRF